jgi:hypothetical protein
MSNLLLGSDPELFLKNRNGQYIPALGIIPGSKDNPTKIQHGSIQPDGCAAEFNIIPAATEQDFIKNHLLVMEELANVVKVHDLELDISASAIFDEELLTRVLCEAGCSPDFDAWRMEVNQAPAYQGGLRAAGGHVHISFPTANDYTEARRDFVRALDLYLGVPSVLMDKDRRRRSLYGKAGCHRPKFMDFDDPYDGIEYRSLSNFWLKDQRYMAWVFQQVSKVNEIYRDIQGELEQLGSHIIRCINEGDEAIASTLVQQWDLEVV